MSFRRAFIGICRVLRCTPAAALAQDARQVEIGYEITFAGVAGFRIDVIARFNGTTYDVETSTFKEGMLKAVTMNYVGRNRAWGGFSPQGAQPIGGLAVDHGRRQAAHLAGAVWRRRLPAGDAHAGLEARPRSRRSPTPTSRARSIRCRRRSASASPATPPAIAPCRSNDGKRRIDVMFRKIGMEPAATTGIPGAQGDVLVCEIYTKRIAGEFDDAPKEAETERERPMRIWLAPLRRHADPLSRQARGPDRLRHDPRPAAVVPRTAAHSAGKPGDEEIDCRPDSYAARLWLRWRRMERISAAAAGMLVPGP